MNKNQIRICYIIDAIEIGGTEKQLIEIIRKLDSNKFKVYLVCLRNSVMLEKTEIDCNKLVLNIQSFKSFGIIKKILFFWWFLVKEKIDIFHTFFPDANLFGVFVARLARVKQIISSRRDMGFWYSDKELKKLKRINKFVNRFLANSKAVKDNVFQKENVPKDKIDVIYNGVNLQNFVKSDKAVIRKIKEQLAIPNDHIIVGCIANFNRRVKRVDIFIEAAAAMINDANNVSFLIIGDGYLREELVELSLKRQMQNKIIFTGERNDILSLLQVIDIGVLTSDSEGFSNTILEYMAAGIPVVATAVAANKELIDHNRDGLLVPPQDPQSVAEAILKFLKNRNLRFEFAKNAKQKLLQKYSMEQMIINLENYYLNLFSLHTNIQNLPKRPPEIS